MMCEQNETEHLQFFNRIAPLFQRFFEHLETETAKTENAI